MPPPSAVRNASDGHSEMQKTSSMPLSMADVIAQKASLLNKPNKPAVPEGQSGNKWDESGRAAETGSSLGGGMNLLSSIRSAQSKLRKVESPFVNDNSSASSVFGGVGKKKTAESNEVAAILMRRVALEMSDSEALECDFRQHNIQFLKIYCEAATGVGAEGKRFPDARILKKAPLKVAEEAKADEEETEKTDEKVKEISNWVLLGEIWGLLKPDWVLLLSVSLHISAFAYGKAHTLGFSYQYLSPKIVTITTMTAAVNIATPIAIGDLVSVVQNMVTTASSESAASAAAVAATSTAASTNAISSLAASARALLLPPDADIPFTLLRGPALKILGLFMLQGFLTFIDIALVSRLGENISRRMRRDLYSSLLRQDMAFFDARMQGEVVGRLTQDVAEFKHTFKIVITQGLKCVAQVIGSAIHLIRISSSLTTSILCTMPFLYVAMNIYGAFLRKLSRSARNGDSEASGVAGEAISNIRTVRAFAAEDREIEKYCDAVASASALNTKLGFHIGLFQGITNTSIGSLILMILFYGGTLVARGAMTGGQLMTYMVATQNAQKSLALVGVLFGQVIRALGSAARVFEYIHMTPKIPVKGGMVLEKFRGEIEFRDVDFTYPTRPEHRILQRFNLKIPVGRVVALCGASGSGKSTIGQLIERFYDPDNGDILIDGISLKKLDPRYGRPDATREEIEEAARKANAADFIDAFPKKYDTVVGERGVTLSGGQKQRIAIARALLKDPRILILDEATSALDAQSERLVQDALDRLMTGRTVLVIAHRLSTIQNADMIVVMSGSGVERRSSGNIVEMGTHAQLMRKRGAYFDLYNRMAAEESE
ncbi:ATP-binding cassette, sub-B (MDR TAP), member 8 [Quaeritorhiza haematococci]|nr:ATP-binding cassette, sub-B (MDR TAP), member 8 [Quaeritorhiza haematococci]